MDDARVLEALAVAGFHGWVRADGNALVAPPAVAEIRAVPVEQGAGDSWTFDAGQSRLVVVDKRVEGSSTVWSISIEEWRGGEGYEDVELVTTNADELLAALPRWVAWAREPWQKRTPRTWRERLCAALGIPWDN